MTDAQACFEGPGFDYTELESLAVRLCAELQCHASEIELIPTPEGLFQFRLERLSTTGSPQQATRIGSAQLLCDWAALRQ
jgi:hypothetical protein